MQTTTTAYHGDNELKRRVIEQTTTLIRQGRWLATETPSLHALLGREDESLTHSLGIPLAVTQLQDILLANLDPEGDAAQQHVLQWLSTITVGSRLEPLIPRFIESALEYFAEPGTLLKQISPGVQQALHDVAHLHRGSTADDADWRVARQRLMALTDSLPAGLERMLCGLAETVAWPASQAPEELIGAIASLLDEYTWLAENAAYNSKERDLQAEAQCEVERFLDAGNTYSEQAIAVLPAVEAFERQVPQSRQEQARNQGHLAKQRLALSLYQRLITVTRQLA
jgi:hypothetical protein